MQLLHLLTILSLLCTRTWAAIDDGGVWDILVNVDPGLMNSIAIFGDHYERELDAFETAKAMIEQEIRHLMQAVQARPDPTPNHEDRIEIARLLSQHANLEVLIEELREMYHRSKDN